MRQLIALVLALAVAWIPRTSHAGPIVRVSTPVARAGEAVELSWGDLPRGAHEVELEVSLDGGRWLRISPELEASEGAFRWGIPAGFSGEARLRLRWGGEGYESDGIIASLRIEPTAALHPVPGNEWWDVHASAPAEPRALDCAQPAFSPLALPAAVLVSPQALDAPRTGHPLSTVLRDNSRHVARPRGRAFSPPRVTPLRN